MKKIKYEGNNIYHCWLIPVEALYLIENKCVSASYNYTEKNIKDFIKQGKSYLINFRFTMSKTIRELYNHYNNMKT